MLAHVVNEEGLLELTAATVKQAIKDLSCSDPKHQASARYFLEQAGLLQHALERYDIELNEERHEQLALFT